MLAFTQTICLFGQFDFVLFDHKGMQIQCWQMSMLNYYVSIFGWCSLQSNRVVSVDKLLVTLEGHRVSW